MSTISSNSRPSSTKPGGASLRPGGAGQPGVRPPAPGSPGASRTARSSDSVSLSPAAREDLRGPETARSSASSDGRSLEEKVSSLQSQLDELQASAPDRTPGRFSPIDNEGYGRSSFEREDQRGPGPNRTEVNPADFENYRGGDAPDRTPGRFSPIDNEGYGRSSFERGDGAYDNQVGGRAEGVKAPPAGGGAADPNQSLQSLAKRVLRGQLGSNPQNTQRQKLELAEKCRELAGRGFQPDFNTRAVVVAALGSDPFSTTAI